MYYLTREKECLLWEMTNRGKKIIDRSEAVKRWKDVARMETGLAPLDTPAGRARSDACVQVRLFLPLPNMVFDGMTKAEIKDALTSLVRELGLDSTDVMWSLHKGVPGGSGNNQRDQNLHLHVSYRPRNEGGKKHRICIRREVVTLREVLGGWLQERGYEIDWKSISNPGKRRHISPDKITIAERGELLHSPEKKLQADLALAKRLVSKLSRSEAREIILACLRSDKPAYSTLENELHRRGWNLSRIIRGKRKTWILTDGDKKEYALRRILEEKEKSVDALMKVLKGNDLSQATTLEKNVPVISGNEGESIPSENPCSEPEEPWPDESGGTESDEKEPFYNNSPFDRSM